MAEIDKIEAKEETLREDLSEAIDELEEELDDDSVRSDLRYAVTFLFLRY